MGSETNEGIQQYYITKIEELQVRICMLCPAWTLAGWKASSLTEPASFLGRERLAEQGEMAKIVHIWHSYLNEAIGLNKGA